MDLIKELKLTQIQTLEYFELDELHLEKTYAEGKWCVRFLLHHLADAETVLYDRIRRIISEPRQVIWAFRQDDWAKMLNYEEMPLSLNSEIFRSVRNSIIYLAENYYELLEEKDFVHSETGVRTLKDEFEKVVWHNAHHLKQIEQALNR